MPARIPPLCALHHVGKRPEQPPCITGTMSWLSSPPFTLPSPVRAIYRKPEPGWHPNFFKDPPPALALPGAGEKGGGGTTPQRGPGGCSLYGQSCFGDPAPPQCWMALEWCLQTGISICCQDFVVGKYLCSATSWSCCLLSEDFKSILFYIRKQVGKKVLDWDPATKAQF